MSNIESTRSHFFPKSKSTRPTVNESTLKKPSLNQKIGHKQKTDSDAKIVLSDTIKDFNLIKKAADSSLTMDQSEKIGLLQRKIALGEYKIDYDALADKILSQEF